MVKLKNIIFFLSLIIAWFLLVLPQYTNHDNFPKVICLGFWQKAYYKMPLLPPMLLSMSHPWVFYWLPLDLTTNHWWTYTISILSKPMNTCSNTYSNLCLQNKQGFQELVSDSNISQKLLKSYRQQIPLIIPKVMTNIWLVTLSR